MATNQLVKLFGFVGSPFVARAEVALKLKRVPYEYIQESLTNKSDLLLKYNPVHKKVPVLLHKDKPICESLVIVEYVDEAWPGHPILPSDPYHRAQARFWSRFIDEKVIPAVFKAAWGPNEKERENGTEETKEALRILDKELKLKGKFFNGDSLGLVDIAALIIAFWVPIIQEAGGLDLYSGAKYPKLDKWGREIGCVWSSGRRLYRAVHSAISTPETLFLFSPCLAWLLPVSNLCPEATSKHKLKIGAFLLTCRFSS